MKKLSIILNVILFILVGILFYLHFSDVKYASDKDSVSQKDSSQHTDLRIAYVNIDSLEAHYSYFQKKKAELEKKQESIQKELSTRAQAIQNDIAQLQKKAPTMTQSEGEAAQRKIIEKRQALQNKEQDLRQTLMNDQQKFNEDLHNRLNQFLEKYNVGKDYTYILSYSSAVSDILYKDSSYDITEDVVTGLNEVETQSAGGK